jgi:hypothetical protein
MVCDKFSFYCRKSLFDQVDHRAEKIEKQFDEEPKRLNIYNGKLERFKEVAQSERDRSWKRSYNVPHR